MNLKLAGNITSMGDDCVSRNAEMVGDFLIRHTLNERDNHILLTVGQCFWVLADTAFEHHVGNILGNIALFYHLLETTDGWHEDVILHFSVLTQPRLVLIDIVKSGGELIVVQAVLRQIFNNQQL